LTYYFFNKFNTELIIIPKIAIATKLTADIKPAALNLLIQLSLSGKNNNAIHGKTKIKPIKMVKILFKLPFLITDIIDDSIANIQATENNPKVKYNATSIMLKGF
tara:strand:- start:844 stop:1158 length:315 start_codon:yes stop_codon:yes gene_type:complete